MRLQLTRAPTPRGANMRRHIRAGRNYQAETQALHHSRYVVTWHTERSTSTKIGAKAQRSKHSTEMRERSMFHVLLDENIAPNQRFRKFCSPYRSRDHLLSQHLKNIGERFVHVRLRNAQRKKLYFTHYRLSNIIWPSIMTMIILKDTKANLNATNSNTNIL